MRNLAAVERRACACIPTTQGLYAAFQGVETDIMCIFGIRILLSVIGSGVRFLLLRQCCSRYREEISFPAWASVFFSFFCFPLSFLLIFFRACLVFMSDQR